MNTDHNKINMNRRNFFKTTTLGLGATMLAPTIALGVTAEVPLYKQFDWLTHPASLLFRIEDCDGKQTAVCTPVVIKTWLLKITSHHDIDLTQQTFTEKTSSRSGRFVFPRRNRVSDVIGVDDQQDFEAKKHLQTYYTNELLLNEAKRTGITHLYSFVKSPCPIINPYGSKYVTYSVRGVKRPDWKTVDGKLQVVEVDKDGDLIYPKKYGY